MNLSADKRSPEGGNAGAVSFGGTQAASAQFTAWDDEDDGFVQLTPKGWNHICNNMAASIVRLECEADELRAEVAMLREEQKILVRERNGDRRTIEILRESRDRYKRMAGISSDWETAESVRDKFSAGEGEGCEDE